MDRTIKLLLWAALLALAPQALALAAPPVLQDKKSLDTVTQDAMNSTPQAVFSQTKFEFDPVFEGAEITHDFVVENRGQAPLVINKIRPD